VNAVRHNTNPVELITQNRVPHSIQRSKSAPAVQPSFRSLPYTSQNGQIVRCAQEESIAVGAASDLPANTLLTNLWKLFKLRQTFV
jgi:hypothetical protein